MSSKSPCSVLILTLNEEINIGKCINSVSWSDDIVVLDSYSEDKTVEIAEDLGARIVQRRFDDWSTHQNWAVNNIEFNHPWVLYIDADELCTQELRDEIIETLESSARMAAFRLRRKDFFMGRWLKHAQLYPTWIVRLFRPERIRYERLVNPVAIVNGKVGELRGHLYHYPFSHGISHWIERHNKYSSMEAVEALKVRRQGRISARDCLTSDPTRRRACLKNLFFLLPARPILKFLYYFVLRCGFLDGYPGLTYSILQAIYEYFIILKTHELKMKNAGLGL